MSSETRCRPFSRFLILRSPPQVTTNAVKHISITNKSLTQSHSTICNPSHRKIPVAYATVKDAREAKTTSRRRRRRGEVLEEQCHVQKKVANVKTWLTASLCNVGFVLSTSSVPVSNGRRLAVAAISPGHGCCLLLQDLLQSCSRVGRGIVEDMCYKPRLVWTGLTITH
jgi:hypothetical protein